jgi:tetratricopeptide (TPR) repeat protein
MRRHVLRLSLLIALCSLASVSVPCAQAPASTGPAAFAGRWQFSVQPATGSGPATPYLIVQITASASGVTASIVDVFMSPLFSGKVKEVAVKDGQLELVVEISGRQISFQGRRVGDRIEGTTKAAGETREGKWEGKTTTGDSLPAPETAADRTPDAKAFSAAMNNPREARTVALKQFLVDFPASPLAPQAAFTLAQGAPNPTDRIAAYQRFVQDYPKSIQVDDARLQIALLETDRGAALRKFISDFPTSRNRERAEYELTLTITNAADRQAAQDKFTTAYPRSIYASDIYRSQLDPLMRAKPLNEARLNAVIDGFINASSDMTLPLNAQYTMNLRAGAMNTVADRLMANEVMLDRALNIIQKALALAGEKEEPGSRAIFTTTHGQVLFKLKRYDEAGDALKRAVQISGAEGSGETQLFLGKFYEVKGDEDAALAAYLKAYEKGSPLDTKVSLERLYIKKYGSLASLEAKLDEMYLAKPKPFQPGHYTRPAAPTGKTVLAELFTGAECVPCVAADLAFDGLTERFDRQSVAVLVYHLHIPGPDPMTNDDTEARAKVYEVKATPTAVIDGAALPASGGSAAMAERAFNEYKGKIEPRLAAKPLASLTGIKAKLSGETISVTGDVTLSPDFAAGSTAALHVVLVEDSIRYVGANGVRFHNFVVRKLMGTPAGTPLTKAGAKTPFSESVSLSSVTTSLDAYLDKYEKTRSQRTPFTFKDRVDTLDPKKVLVVVFAQDEKTKEILQSVVVTVER